MAKEMVEHAHHINNQLSDFDCKKESGTIEDMKRVGIHAFVATLIQCHWHLIVNDHDDIKMLCPTEDVELNINKWDDENNWEISFKLIVDI